MDRFRPIDIGLISSLLEYAPELEGSCLRWKATLHGGVKIGSIAGCSDNEGYWLVKVNHALYKAHRLVWTIVKGEDPPCQIDHINGDTGDNRIENLRLAFKNETDNGQNRKVGKNNTSGYIGVRWHKRNKKWMAVITVNKKRRYLGYFNAPEEAYNAYLTAKAELHTFNPTVRNRLN